MKYLTGWWWGVYSATSGRTVLSGDALGAAGDSTCVWPLFGLFMCSWFQTLAPENAGRTVLSGDALEEADDSTGVWLLFGLFMCSRFQTPAPENATCGKNMIGWKLDFFYNWEFSGDFW